MAHGTATIAGTRNRSALKPLLDSANQPVRTLHPGAAPHGVRV